MEHEQILKNLTSVVQQQTTAIQHLQMESQVIRGRLDLLTSFLLNNPNNYEAFYNYVDTLADAELPLEEEMQKGAKYLQKVAQDYKKKLKNPHQKASTDAHHHSNDSSVEAIVIPFPVLDPEK